MHFQIVPYLTVFRDFNNMPCLVVQVITDEKKPTVSQIKQGGHIKIAFLSNNKVHFNKKHNMFS